MLCAVLSFRRNSVIPHILEPLGNKTPIIKRAKMKVLQA